MYLSPQLTKRKSAMLTAIPALVTNKLPISFLISEAESVNKRSFTVMIIH